MSGCFFLKHGVHTHNFGITMVMTSTSASVEANLATFIAKNLLSEDAIVTFVKFRDRYRTLFYINVHFKWYIFQG